MNCIIVDDDSISRKLVERCVEKTSSLNLIGSFASVNEVLIFMQTNSVDLIFLDIEMPEISGLDFIKTFHHDMPQIIIVSGKDKYAIDAFNYDVTDYILKPITYNRFVKAVVKAFSKQVDVKVNPKENKNLFIKKDKTYINVALNSIHYIEALGDYVNVYTLSQRYTVLSSMKSIEGLLPESEFVRIHNSFIVRIDKITEIQNETLNCMGKIIPISRTRKTDFHKKINFL